VRILFKNARLILPPRAQGGGIVFGSLLVEKGFIRQINTTLGPESEGSCDEVIDCGEDYLAPGFIDLHCHGALGRDTMEASAEAFETILNFHATRGTTLVMLTTVAASLEEMERVLVAAETYQQKSPSSQLAGIHLEGPYFSPHRRGAHRTEMLRHPTPQESGQLLRHAEVIYRMTLAPELPGSLALIQELVCHDIAVSAGHSNATEAEALAGFAAGITQATHLYNCMSSLQSEGGSRLTGLAEAALTTKGILCELIADGRHLSSTLLRLAWLAKGWDSVALVSDATAGAGLPEGSVFELGGLPCRIEQRSAWTGEGAERRLAGSTIGMIDGVRVMVEQAGVPLEEGVAMASLAPARALGLEEERGSLAVGKRADLLRFSSDWQVEGVWSAGVPIL
jgi:N-acetylglucosamine-6-phosphate deacetylase